MPFVISLMGLLIDAGRRNHIPIPTQIHAAPTMEIHNNALCNPGPAAGLSGSVAVNICKFTTDRATNNTIIATNMPMVRVSFVFIFIDFIFMQV